MAQVQMPIAFKAKGKLGNVVFYERYGKSFIRIKPFNPKNPKTPGQLKQRLRFSLINDLDRYICKFTRKGFPEATNHMSQFNAFMNANIKTAVAGTYPDMDIDFPSLVVARGSLCRTTNYKVTSRKKLKVSVEWIDNSGIGNARSTDRAMILLINPADRRIVMDITSSSREDGRLTFEVPYYWENEDVHAYLAFRNAFGDKTSESVYLGSIRIAGQDDPDALEKQDTSFSKKTVAKVGMTSTVAEDKLQTACKLIPEKKINEYVNGLKINYIYKEEKSQYIEENTQGKLETTITYPANIFALEVSITILKNDMKPEPISVEEDSEKVSQFTEVISWNQLLENLPTFKEMNE